jgi:hypothetical protein
MIKEAIVAESGILFKDEPLKSMGFDFVQLAHELDQLGLDVQRFGLNPSLLQLPVVQQAASSASTPSTAVSRSPELTTRALIPVPSLYSSLSTVLHHSQRLAVAVKHAEDIRDAVAALYDQLVASKPWWILETIPMLTTYQEQSGKWTRKRV